ncbi:MAG: hypothetical protein J1E85_08695 [Ruminococcus sp.]|nr:hypothetical protein [Ruminococcus sp.]
MKTRILVLLSALAISSALAGCSATAINYSDDNDKITLTDIVYNSESKSLDYTLTNGTDDKLVDYTSRHRIYKIENGKEVCVTPSYTSYGTSTRLYPESFVKFAKEYANSESAKSSDTLGCLTYKAEGDNYDQAYEFENSALQSGEYKLVVEVDIYDYKEENNKVIGDDEEKYLIADFDYDYPHTTLTLEGSFTIQ